MIAILKLCSISLIIAAVSVLSETMAAETLPGLKTITVFPLTLDPSCRDGMAKLYDQCRDQLEVLDEATSVAKSQKKVVLVVFGAEWCIWCHVLNSHLHGTVGEFTYTYGTPDEPEILETDTFYEKAEIDVGAQAATLNSFVADNYVIAEIDSMYAPSGEKVLELTGAFEAYDGSLPFVFAVDENGHYAAKLDHEKIETRRDGFFDWYRGYDRQALLGELMRMQADAGR